jgi:hypothetical protein
MCSAYRNGSPRRLTLSFRCREITSTSISFFPRFVPHIEEDGTTEVQLGRLDPVLLATSSLPGA